MSSRTLTRADVLHENVISGYLGRQFVERGWLARRVERHLHDPECRFVLLSGGPGTGKSAFLSWLTVLQALSPRYFIRRLSTHPLASGDAWSLLLSVGHQLAVLRPEVMRLDLDVEVVQDIGRVAAGGTATGVRVGELRTSPFHRTAMQVEQHVETVEGSVVGIEIDRMVADVRLDDLGNLQGLALLDPALRLARQDPESIIVVLIDAIDELRYQWSAYAGRGDIVEWLAQCPELPANLRIVVTSRPDRQLLQRFRLAQADWLREEEISASAAEVYQDLLTYAERVLAEPALASLSIAPGTSTARLARQVAERARGSFLYLVMWGRALRQAHGSGDQARVDTLTDLSALPAGLDGIYEYFLVLVRETVVQRAGAARWRTNWNTTYRPLLGVLAVAQAPLTVDDLGLLTGLASDRNGIAEAVADLAQFLEWDGPRTRLCHVSLAEFLADASDDDWHVDAEQSHHDVASRLIDEFGDSWETCEDDYALANTVVHLVAALRTARSPEAQRRSARTLTELLAVPDFGIAKATRIGVAEMLTDYVAANAALRGPAPGSTADLATGLADTMAVLTARGAPDLPDTLHAIVGYRLDATDLNEAVLSRLTDPGYLADRVPSERSQTTSLTGFSHAQATRLRRTGHPDKIREARRILEQAASAAQQPDSPEATRHLSSMFYDLAYLHYLHGDHDQAHRWFQRSIEAAEQAGDPTGAHITRLVALRADLLRQAVDPGTFRNTVTDALAFFQSDAARKPHAERWVMNAHAYLLDVAVLTGDADAARAELEAFEEDPWVRQFARSDFITLWQARVALVTGDPARACDLFEQRLRNELTDPPPPREELARDLYDYGRALLANGEPANAQRIWELGLRCPDNAANWPWYPAITQALQDLPT